jgi:hypothetical protein
MIVSAYVVLRACEIILKPKSAFASATARVIMILLACIVIGVTGI